MTENKNLVLCDFDGTITTQDVTNLIIDHFTGNWWRKEVLPRYWNGEIGHLQVMVECYAPLTVPEPELIEFALANIKVRTGFDDLVRFCKEQGAELAVVSGGIDFYIKPFLPPGLPYYSYTGELGAKGWNIRRPDWPTLKQDQDFKVGVMEELKARYNPFQVVFIGDGRNDFPLAQEADVVFTVTNSRLSILCNENNIPHTDFTDFDEVVELLQEKSGVRRQKSE